MIINKDIGAPEKVEQYLKDHLDLSFPIIFSRGYKEYTEAVYFHLYYQTLCQYMGEKSYEIKLSEHLKHCSQEVENASHDLDLTERKEFLQGALFAEKVYHNFILLAFRTKDHSVNIA